MYHPQQVKILIWLLVSFNFPKTLMVLLLCLTFVGQAVAAAVMPYHMMSMSGNSAQLPDEIMMDHSKHNMAESFSGDSDDSSEDCCVKTCSCFTGGCSTVAVFMKNIGSSPIIDLSAKILSHSPLADNQQSTSLYRPPILS